MYVNWLFIETFNDVFQNRSLFNLVTYDVTFLSAEHLFGLTQFLPQSITLRRVPLHRTLFWHFLAFKNAFFDKNDPPLERAWNGRDFDAKIDHDSTEIYGLFMIYSFYVV